MEIIWSTFVSSGCFGGTFQKRHHQEAPWALVRKDLLDDCSSQTVFNTTFWCAMFGAFGAIWNSKRPDSRGWDSFL